MRSSILRLAIIGVATFGLNVAGVLDANSRDRIAGSRPASQAKKEATNASGRYFVEFRSRYALSYGHTFLVHGKLNPKGEIGPIRAEQVAGLHPAGEGPQLWSVGHVVPVPSETGPSDGDLEEQYVSARFRVVLTEGEYRKAAAYIYDRQQNSPLWHAVMYNCNAFVGDIAKYMGLQAPSNTLLYPAEFINELAALNKSPS